MIVRPRSQTVEAFRVNDDQLPALIRRIGEVVQIDAYADGRLFLTCNFEDGRFLNATEGDYVVFDGDAVTSMDAATFTEKYEAVPEFRIHGGFIPNKQGWMQTSH